MERLEDAGLGKLKRPDLLIFNRKDLPMVDKVLQTLGGATELPFLQESTPELQELLGRALLAIECENSLWRATKMPDYGKPLTPQKRLDGKLGLRKAAVLPTIIIKEEDRFRLLEWQESTGVKIHIWHAFFDMAYGLSLDRAEALVKEGITHPTEQTFQAPAGATQKKIIYKHYYHYGYSLARMTQEPNLLPMCIEDKNGHILPYVTFSGGELELTEDAIDILATVDSA